MPSVKRERMLKDLGCFGIGAGEKTANVGAGVREISFPYITRQSIVSGWRWDRNSVPGRCCQSKAVWQMSWDRKRNKIFA